MAQFRRPVRLHESPVQTTRMTFSAPTGLHMQTQQDRCLPRAPTPGRYGAVDPEDHLDTPHDCHRPHSARIGPAPWDPWVALQLPAMVPREFFWAPTRAPQKNTLESPGRTMEDVPSRVEA